MKKPNIIFMSGAVDAINPECTDRRFFTVLGSAHVRRPEVLQLAERLHKEHPIWSANKCLKEAKLRITERRPNVLGVITAPKG